MGDGWLDGWMDDDGNVSPSRRENCVESLNIYGKILSVSVLTLRSFASFSAKVFLLERCSFAPTLSLSPGSIQLRFDHEFPSKLQPTLSIKAIQFSVPSLQMRVSHFAEKTF